MCVMYSVYVYCICMYLLYMYIRSFDKEQTNKQFS